jgi:hypothetical protein
MTTKAKPVVGRSLDLGQLQKEVESATRTLKAANTALNKATTAQQAAEQSHATLLKAMTAAMAQFQAATKVV